MTQLRPPALTPNGISTHNRLAKAGTTSFRFDKIHWSYYKVALRNQASWEKPMIEFQINIEGTMVTRSTSFRK